MTRSASKIFRLRLISQVDGVAVRIAPDGASVGRDGRGVPHGGVAIKGQTAPRSTRGGRVVDQGVCVPESPRGVLGTTPADTGD